MSYERMCAICGRPLRLYKKENYDLNSLNDYAFASRKIPELMHYRLDECVSCHALFSYCPMEVQEIFNKYKEADYDSGQEANNASATYFAYLKKYLPDYPRGKALDIGTGNGSYLSLLRGGGVREVIGVEPSVAPIEAADNDIRDHIINDVFRKELFDEGAFDMVSLFQTIEHIPDIMGTINDIRSITKKGGYFYVVCHDYRSLVNRVLGMKSPIYDIEHLQILSKKSLRRILEKAGFGDIKIFTIWNKYPLHYWIKLFPIGKGIKEKVLRSLNNSWLGRLNIAINVGNIGALARK